MIALKVLGYRVEQFEFLVCPAQQLGMKQWVIQSRGGREPVREIVGAVDQVVKQGQIILKLVKDLRFFEETRGAMDRFLAMEDCDKLFRTSEDYYI